MISSKNKLNYEFSVTTLSKLEEKQGINFE